MKKIFLVLQREYLVRVRKPSFLLMTFLTPFLFSLLFVIPIWLMVGFEKERIIQVVDESNLFAGHLPQKEKLKFVIENKDFKTAKEDLDKNKKSQYYALLHIPAIDPKNPQGIQLYSKSSIGLEIQLDIERALRNTLEDIKLIEAGIDKKALEAAKVPVKIELIQLGEQGEKNTNAAAAQIISFIATFMIYISLFLYGSQVMRGVVEEKTSRIIEVMISSVRPFELMMGKILGIALIGLTQFLLWIVLTVGLTTVTSSFFNLEKYSQQRIENTMKSLPEEAQKDVNVQKNVEVSKIMKAVDSINFPLVIGCFLIYFLGGYFLYSAMFAAVGSAVDSETETQQFVLPISMPIIVSFVIAQFIAREPDGAMAFWLSMVPFTSPIIMMLRVPFGVPLWQLGLSIFLLVVTFIWMTWLAARIYRIGILMYGKKASFKEIGKWMFAKY